MILKVRDRMSKSVACVSPTTSVVETAQLMQKHNIGSIPVCDQSGLVGIVTDRDIVVRNVAHGNNPQSTVIRDVMTSNVKTLTPDMDFSTVPHIMAEQKLRRLPVVENNKLVGIVTLGDVSTEHDFGMEASKALSEISEPSKPEKI